MKTGYIYLLTNWTGAVLYTGVTSNLEQRIWQHKQKLVDGFSKQYELEKLVYYEVYDDISEAIKREKQIKNWRRDKKNKLVLKMNPKWKDLSEGWYEDSSTRVRSVGMTKGGAS